MVKKKDKKRILEFLSTMDWAFQINNFEKEIVFKEKDDGNQLAEVTFEEDYQRITVKIYPSFFEQSLTLQRKTLLHELCHSITIPSKQAAHALLDGKLVTPDRLREINEAETSKIENLMDSLLKGNLKYAIEAYKNYIKPKKKKGGRKR